MFPMLQAGQSSVAVNQIELDLLRTLPTNKYYDKPDAQGVCVCLHVHCIFHQLVWSYAASV